ncbi:uncharacterized protein [Rutidosis leptorrhynchoides]|uniref:uncharacterized protein n=1 Tax=Rutidosis leptorrhynchoides TaxID=125765 RepID=UPI003A9A22E8
MVLLTSMRFGKVSRGFSTFHGALYNTHLTEHKNIPVKEIFNAPDGERIAWNWSRQLRGRAIDELHDLSNLLSNISLSDRRDNWSWLLDPSSIFITKKLTNIIDLQLIFPNSQAISTLCNPSIPLKVEIFVWRARLQRILVCLELDKRRFDLDIVRCPLCDDDLESVEHILVKCICSKSLWDAFFPWWGFNNDAFNNMEDIFKDDQQNINSFSGRRIWQSLKWVCAYNI